MQKSEEQRPLPGLWVHATPHRDVTLPHFSTGVAPLKNVLLQIASATAPGSALDSLTLGQAESLRKTHVEAQPLPNTPQILGRLCPGQFCPAGHPPWHDDSCRMTLALGSLCATLSYPGTLANPSGLPRTSQAAISPLLFK